MLSSNLPQEREYDPTDQKKYESAFSEQTFYPSFGVFNNHPLGHSRPFYFNQQQEGAYSQRSQPYQQRFGEAEK